MAFDDVTFFELHLDDARFGAGEATDADGVDASGRRGNGGDEVAESAAVSGSHWGVLLVGLVLLVGAAAVLRRRLALEADEEGGEDPIEIEADAAEMEN